MTARVVPMAVRVAGGAAASAAGAGVPRPIRWHARARAPPRPTRGTAWGNKRKGGEQDARWRLAPPPRAHARRRSTQAHAAVAAGGPAPAQATSPKGGMSGKTIGRLTLPMLRSIAKSPRDGRSAMLAFDGTHIGAWSQTSIAYLCPQLATIPQLGVGWLMLIILSSHTLGAVGGVRLSLENSSVSCLTEILSSGEPMSSSEYTLCLFVWVGRGNCMCVCPFPHWAVGMGGPIRGTSPCLYSRPCGSRRCVRGLHPFKIFHAKRNAIAIGSITRVPGYRSEQLHRLSCTAAITRGGVG
eukprot:scaffold2260_cov134-Isochrysis_galbana.AAC.6